MSTVHHLRLPTLTRTAGAKSAGDELAAALKACRPYFANAAAFSFAINLLYLASPIYMLQVYDRVVSSSSVATLVMLTIVLVVTFATLAVLDALRARLLTRAGVQLDRLLAGRVLTALLEKGSNAEGARSQPIRDFDSLRQFIAGRGIHAAFDIPWTPIYIAIIFVLHPGLGAFALACAVVLIAMAILNEWLTHSPLREANEAANANYSFSEMSLRNAEVVRAMGMAPGLLRRWAGERAHMIARQTAASDHGATMGSVIRFLRLSMQSLILGLGAYLVIQRSVTAGVIFAGSMLLSRALQPTEQVVGAWRSFVSAWQSFLRIRALLNDSPPESASLALPRPTGRLSVEGVCSLAPHSTKPILRGVSFRLEPGEVLGIIGPSGSGKTTLVRHIIGIASPTAGIVRLDGADVATWPRAALGQHIGYLPQDVELFAASVAANMARFGDMSSERIIAAAQMAGVHEMILRLPNGYETQVGEGGMVLSGGYRQRIGLARAVLGNPSLVVLDEPSSHLDADGDAALAACILQLKQNKTSVVLVSHRPSTIATADKVLLIMDGAVAGFGPRADVLARLARQAPPAAVLATRTP